MGFLKNVWGKSIAFKNWALSVSKVYVELDEIEGEMIYYSSNFNNINNRLLTIARYTKSEIIDKMNEFDAGPTTKVALKNLPYQRVTVLFAYQKTVGRLVQLAQETYIKEELNQILEL